jgi:5-hydroxyisourate hydrolase
VSRLYGEPTRFCKGARLTPRVERLALCERGGERGEYAQTLLAAVTRSDQTGWIQESLAKNSWGCLAALDRREAASSVAPVFEISTNAGGWDAFNCVVPGREHVASRRPSHPVSERIPPNPPRVPLPVAASLSTHVLDLERGVPAQGVKVELYRLQELVASAETDDDGRIGRLAENLAPDTYRLVFHPASSPFFRRIELEVQIEEGAENLHIPLLISPYACTSYRGS